MNLRNLTVSAAVAVAALSIATAASAQANTSTANVSGAAKIIRPITITATGTIDFGTIVKPRSDGTAGVVTVTNAATADRTKTGDVVLLGSTFSRPVYTITGEGGQSYTLTVPANFSMSGPSSSSLTVTLLPDLSTGTRTFNGATLGNEASETLRVGASIPVSKDTVPGAYAGNYDVTVTYN